MSPGSMSDDQIETAQREVLKRFKPRDIVALFDIRYMIVHDLERSFAEYANPEVFGRGGTDASEVLEFAKQQGAKTILYSDGWLMNDQVVQFNEFVEI